MRQTGEALATPIVTGAVEDGEAGEVVEAGEAGETLGTPAVCRRLVRPHEASGERAARSVR